MRIDIKSVYRIAFISVLYLSAAVNMYGQHKGIKNTELKNGLWFNSRGFESRTVYSVNGVFTFQRPQIIDTTIDLQGSYIVPPLAEAHNHNLGTGNPETDKATINRYLNAGVFYVSIPGNLPFDEKTNERLGYNQPRGLDVRFANGTVTAPNGHPIRLMESLLPRGYFPGYNKESLNNVRYFTVSSIDEFKNKWVTIKKFQPDFIKIMICRADSYEKFRNDSLAWYKGLNPELLPELVEIIHREGYKVTAHIINPFDLQLAVKAGVDEIAHMPRFISGAHIPLITTDEAKLLASRKIPVATTYAISLFQGGAVNTPEIPDAKKYQIETLKILRDAGVNIVIGSDNPQDLSHKEVIYLKELGVFNNLQLLNMWTGNTAKAIFPERKIGELKEGFEASFVALEKDPLTDLKHTEMIKFRFKQGILLKESNGTIH